MALSGIALVTGGAGFIKGDLDFVQGSLADEASLAKAIEDVELVFHEAAIPSVPRSVENPRQTHIASVESTFSLLLAAREHKVKRVVYAASSSAYGDQPTLPKVETMLPEPLSPYAVAKLVGEHYCQVFTRVYGLETVSLRYFNVFGPRQDPSSQYSGVVSRFISDLLGGNRPVIYGDGEQSRDFTYIQNVVDDNLKAAESAKGIGQVINIANGERISLNQLLDELKSLTGKPDVVADYQEPRAGDVKHSLADITRARELLGFEPRVGLRPGLELTIDWWKNSRFAKT